MSTNTEQVELLTKAAGNIERVATEQKAAGERLSAVEQKAADMQADLRAAQQLIDKLETGGGSFRIAGNGPSIGAQLTEGCDENASFTQLKEWNPGSARLKSKARIKSILVNLDSATSSDSTTMPSDAERRGIVGPALPALRLIDALPSRPTSRDSVEFTQLTVTGDAAEQEVEGDEKAEIDFDGIPQTANIVTVAAHTTASRQVLSDHAQLQGVIDLVMRHKVLSRLENRIINGTGGQGKIDGLLSQSTILVPSIATEPADVIGEAVTRMANNGYSPSLVIMNPLDWFRIQLTKTNTEGSYVFGSPVSPQAPGLWNARFTTTPSLAEGKALILDTGHVTVLDREQVSVLVSNTHKDYFTRNLVAILGELRAGLEVTDLNAVYQVDLDFPPLSS